MFHMEQIADCHGAAWPHFGGHRRRGNGLPLMRPVASPSGFFPLRRGAVERQGGALLFGQLESHMSAPVAVIPSWCGTLRRRGPADDATP
jgi:hypothetical protein